MPFPVKLDKIFINLGGRNKVVVDLFKAAAEETQSLHFQAELSNRGVLGAARSTVHNEFVKFLYEAVGAGTSFMELGARTFLLDSVPFEVRENYIYDLTLYLMQSCGFDPRAAAKSRLDDEIYIIRELIIRTITVALSNEVAEAPNFVLMAGFGDSSEHRNPDGRPPELNEEQIRDLRGKARFSEVPDFDFIGFLHKFISKLNTNIADVTQSSNPLYALSISWKKNLQNLSHYFSTKEHSKMLSQVSAVKGELELLKKNKRVLTETLALLMQVSSLIKRSIVFRLAYNLSWWDKLLDGIKLSPQSFLDGILDPTYFIIAQHYLNKSAEGRKLLGDLDKPSNALVQRRANEERGFDSLATEDVMLMILKENHQQENALEKLYELYRQNKIYLKIVAGLSNLNELVGWTVFFSGMVNLPHLTDMLNDHLDSVEEATLIDRSDPIGKDNPLITALQTDKVFSGGRQFRFDNLATLADKRLLKAVCESIQDNLQSLLLLGDLITKQLPSSSDLPFLINTGLIADMLATIQRVNGVDSYPAISNRPGAPEKQQGEVPRN